MRGITTLAFAAALAVLLLGGYGGAAAQEAGLEELFKNLPPEPPEPQAASQPSGAEGGGAAAKPPAGARGSQVVGTPTRSPSPQESWSLGGEQVSVYHLPLLRDPMSYDGIFLEPRIESSFRLDGKYGAFRMVSGWTVDLWPTGTAPGSGTNPLLSSGSADVTLRPGENYLEAATGSLIFQGGYLIDHWGVADGVNPTDNVNPKDYTQSLEPQSLPSFLFRLVYYPIPSLALEGVFEPYKRDDLFAVSAAASIPSSLFAPSQITLSQPPVDLSSSVLGAKVNLYTNAVDLSMSYLFDIDPYYSPEINYANPLDKSLSLVRARIQRIGADAKGSLGPFGLWAEACLSLPVACGLSDASLRKPDLSWIMGSEVRYGPAGLFYLNLQYTGRYIFGYDRSYYTDYPGGMPNQTLLLADPSYALEYYERTLLQPLGDQTAGFLSGILLEADFPFSNGRWSPGLAAAYYLPLLYDTAEETRYGSLVLRPHIEFKPVDAATLTLGAELMYAWKRNPGSNQIVLDQSDDIGMWNDQSNIYLKLDFVW